MGTNPPRVWRDRGVGPRRNPRGALAPHVPANQQSACGTLVSTPIGAVSTLEISLYAPGLLWLERYGMSSDLGMETYLSRLWLDRVVDRKVSPRRALASTAPANHQSASETGVFRPARRYPPGKYAFTRPQVVGVVEIWKGF